MSSTAHQRDPARMEKIVSLCKRRGFIFQSSEIYGGLNGAWDYGPLGVELKRSIRDYWWRCMTQLRDDVVGMDGAILMNRAVWKASGHESTFSDPMVDCKTCKRRYRADQLDSVECGQRPSKTPATCGGEFTEARAFNLMFRTYVGPVEDDSSLAYLRPETAQAIFVQFKNVLEVARKKLPFGIAQIGKAFRNEITPGNFIFRTREFEQMEMQFFIHPPEDQTWFDYWREQRWNYYLEIGLDPMRLRWQEHGPGELAHYAKAAYDIQYEFPFGWQELEGIHNRTDFDLSRHMQASGKDLRYFDERFTEKFVPYIIETSAGCDRTLLTVLVNGYDEIEVKGETRVFLRLSPRIAPIKAAVLPLVNKDGMPEVAEKLFHDLKRKFKVFYDDSGAIGRRYARMDEAGTPYCITVDGQTAQDQTVTVRDRDTMENPRMSMDKIAAFIEEKIRV